MYKIKALTNYNDIVGTINNNDLVLVYAKSNSCKVCDVLLPRVEGCIDKHDIMSILVEIDYTPQFSGQMSVYSVPTVLIFYKGKEVFRQSQFLDMKVIEKELKKWKHSIHLQDY